MERDHSEHTQVALVLFQVGRYRAALEACDVLAMTGHPTTQRTANAHSLLYEESEECGNPPPPARWLTLRNTQTTSEQTASSWQLGVDGDITLQRMPASKLYPLPKLLLPRRFSPALCGFTFDQQQLILLLDANKLNLQALARQP